MFDAEKQHRIVAERRRPLSAARTDKPVAKPSQSHVSAPVSSPAGSSGSHADELQDLRAP